MDQFLLSGRTSYRDDLTQLKRWDRLILKSILLERSEAETQSADSHFPELYEVSGLAQEHKKALAHSWLWWKRAAAFFLLAVWMGIFLSALAVLLEEFTLQRYPKIRNLFKMLFASVLENFGYRQLTSYHRLMGIIDFLRNKKTWGAMTRKGLE